MRVARILIAAVAALSVVALSQAGLAEPAEAAPTGPGISWQYSSEANAYWRAPEDTPAPGNDGPLLAWTQYSSQKDLTCPDGNPDYACAGPPAEIVGIYCSDLPGPTGLPTFAWIRWERTPEPDGTMGPWIGKDADCDEPGDDDVITMDEIHQQVLSANVFQELPRPVPEIKPDPQGLVNLPVIVSTDYPDPTDPLIADDVVQTDPVIVEIEVRVEGGREPFIGTIRAWLDDYVWTFVNGRGETVEVISGRGPGNTYDRNIDPRTNPGHYISHTFREAITGNRVFLNASWVGEIHVEGIGVDEPMTPVPINGESAEFSIVESEPVLGNR
ncbi:hypothetical protein [Tenggerimyces flavus]|uniref:Uncharacterized protein n=1 Tax=Tenggerimyces flavus TaxID=1708749 RepID=A0ABV7YPY1_9ACTN|nr:hypothetical protein [Tenggerimyces flavus]MBM7785810.1 hypothetical protein [Tenggerimyces flavus]